MLNEFLLQIGRLDNVYYNVIVLSNLVNVNIELRAHDAFLY